MVEAGRDARHEADMVVTEQNQLYHHIQIFGRLGHYTVRPDNDAGSEKTFRRYDGALAWAARYLLQSILDEGE